MASRREPRARQPAYIDKLLRTDSRSASGQPARRLDELFLHLGYWPDPATAGSDYTELVAAQGRLNDRLLALSDLRDGLRVLDVGCGIGGTLACIDGRFRGMELVGLNIDPRQLDAARANIRPAPHNRCAWVQADACALPFDTASFDRVLAIECIFHFPSRPRFFSEAARVLRPGGVLVLSDFVATPSLRALRDSAAYPGFALEAAIVPAVGPWPDFWGDQADDAGLATAAGFRLVAREAASHETLPSYRCFLHGKTTAPPDATQLDAVDRAMVVMEWLQAHGHLTMELFVFAR